MTTQQKKNAIETRLKAMGTAMLDALDTVDPNVCSGEAFIALAIAMVITLDAMEEDTPGVEMPETFRVLRSTLKTLTASAILALASKVERGVN